MSHFAKVLDNIVIQVIVAEPEFFDTFVDNSPGEWIQTSYNTRGGVHYKPDSKEPSEDQSKALRKNFAGIGYVYDREKDVFIPPKPYNSWLLNQTSFLWEPPTPYPNDGYAYDWHDDIQSWVLIPPPEGI